MILYIVRHAIAEAAGNSDYEDDSQRPLTQKGRKKMRKIARGLKELEKQLDLILTSPYLRATQTTEVLAKAFELDKEKVLESVLKFRFRKLTISTCDGCWRHTS